MNAIFIKLYGINIKITGNSDFAVNNLKRDFALYLHGEDIADRININICKGAIPYEKVPSLEASLYKIGSVCYKTDNVHYIDYRGKGLMIYDFNSETADIYSEDDNLLYEQARLTILSRIGELLDMMGIHRVHAVGLSKNNKGTICILPMEGGKSTLAIKVLQKDGSIKLASDDVCLIDHKGYLCPFTLRIGARDKELISDISPLYITRIDRKFYSGKYYIDIEYFKNKLAGKSPVRNILIGKRVFQDKTDIRKISKISCVTPFIQSGVFGLGLPQIVELFLRGDLCDIWHKINIVLSRCISFTKLIIRANTYEMRIGRNPDVSAERLIDFITKDYAD